MYTEGIGYPIVNLKTDPEESDRVLEELVEDAYLRVMYSLPKGKRPIEFRERPVPQKR